MNNIKANALIKGPSTFMSNMWSGVEHNDLLVHGRAQCLVGENSVGKNAEQALAG